MICHGWPYDTTLKIPKDSNNPVKAKTLLKLRAEADEIHSEKEKQLQKELQEKRKLREQQMRPEKQSLQEKKKLTVCSETCKSKDAQKGKDPCVGARRILTSSVRQSPRLQRTEPITEVTYFSHFHGNFHVCFDRKFLKAEKVSSEGKENYLQFLQQDERMSNDKRPRLFKVVSITL